MCTIEWGKENSHQHANYLFYSKHKDAFNVARSHKWKKPEFAVKAVSNVANVVCYMTKEGMGVGSVIAGVGGACFPLPG